MYLMIEIIHVFLYTNIFIFSKDIPYFNLSFGHHLRIDLAKK